MDENEYLQVPETVGANASVNASEMVPYEGAISNHNIGDFLTDEKGDDKDFCSKFEQAITPEVCDELFQTLSDWNEILEKDALDIEELQP